MIANNPHPAETVSLPLTVAVIDCFDANHFADVFEPDRYAIIGKNYIDLAACVQLADRLFSALNPEATTQAEWIELEAGHDVRVYDSDSRCLYKAHEKLPTSAR